MILDKTLEISICQNCINTQLHWYNYNYKHYH